MIPHVAVGAEHGRDRLERRSSCVPFGADGAEATGSVALGDGTVHALRVRGGRLVADPLAGKVRWRVTRGARP